MPIKRRRWLKLVPLAVAAFLAVFPLKATTIEVESDDEEIEASPTPAAQAPARVPAKPATASKASPAPASPKTGPAVQSPDTTRRVRVSDKVGFYYFVKAGYAADPGKLTAAGQVVGNMDYNTSYSTPKRTFIEMASDSGKVLAGDLLVVYRVQKPLEEAHSGSLGFRVENLAIVRVVEVQKRKCLVETVKTFDPFQEGDKVESYDVEIQRWKQAQIKKPLPAQPLSCFVVDGESEGGQKRFNQLDFIYLSAGTNQGVVEGQAFRLLKQTNAGVMEEPLRTPVGEAQVIFAGPECSTAQILTNSEPVEKGFLAEYKP